MKKLVMKVRILGCGSSFGVPLIGNKFGKCDSTNKKNYRTRPSIMISHKNKNILIDTSPDLRSQLLNANCNYVDAVLYTHLHADHIHGINDLRAINLITNKIIPAWGSQETINYLTNNFNYIFKSSNNYLPFMKTNIISDTFNIGDIKINSFQHNHGSIDCTTFRIDNFAYTTDIKEFYDESLDKLKGIKKWVIGCLRMDEHPSHASFDKIMGFINYIKPEQAFLTHLTALMDYEELLSHCPYNVKPAYDNLEFEVN